mmetsp:Transcript_71085/g.197468  ORF Transcript_71085/g.197468 Transcript_71085/m.197468 type:complete len:251 (+) Transcript_71085:99-851(+)|eukprot:CAMPEP_0117505302 /NCGR_PEP_ID=MMETSP0784-20121206/25306_1 /TAXON_ID=39447 /ORGANISM="" /LENGTH=250 /DNA_ID=CAMNT_0005300707 /DNA_START=98 /DNA_END=850 /DNA_ORIENTATION=-
MGGEFFFCKKPDASVTEKQWLLTLQLVGYFLEEENVKPLWYCPAPPPIVSFCTEDEFAFQFVDTVCWSGGEPKSFKLKWKWGEDSIQSNLGGRHRTDWSVVRMVCEIITKLLPGKFALVVCDGFNGYNDEAGDMYCDDGEGYKAVDYEYWPWTNKLKPGANDAHVSGEDSTASLEALLDKLKSRHGSLTPGFDEVTSSASEKVEPWQACVRELLAKDAGLGYRALAARLKTAGFEVGVKRVQQFASRIKR